MEKYNVKIIYSIVIILVLYFFELVLLYPFSITSFSEDAIAYYGWSKDIHTNHGEYFSWTTAPGCNIFAIRYIFSYLIGFFTSHSLTLFYTVVNGTELILLFVSTFIFLKLTGTPKKALKIWAMTLPLGIIVWTFICIFASSTISNQWIQVSDLYLIFEDSFILISIGWFLHLVKKIQSTDKINPAYFICFFIFTLYFSLTTIRFLSGALLTESALLVLIVIHDFKINKSLYKPASIILVGLIISFIIGYYGFFMLESYSSSSRYLFMGGLNFAQSLQNGRGALAQYFSGLSNPYHFIIHAIYLIVLVYGLKELLFIFIPRKESSRALNSTQLFGLLTIINFTLVTAAGLFSGGIVFFVVVAIRHYYELSAVFAFLTVMSFIVTKLQYIQSISALRFMSIGGIFVSILFTRTSVRPRLLKSGM